MRDIRPRPVAKMYGVLGLVVLTMALSAAGVLSGTALFLLAVIGMAGQQIILTSLLLSFSSATLLICYMWLTA